MAITLEEIKQLRDETGAGFNLCKEALESAGGDHDKAMDFIRQKGAMKAEKRSGRETAEGVIGVYHHGVDQRVAAMVELNCETDFVARNETFRDLAHTLAMQVAAMKAEYVSREDVPEDVLEKEKEIIRGSDELKGKPDAIADKIVTGKLEKFYQETCLTEQPFFKDEKKTVQNLIDEAVAALGEKIIVSRIYRMEVGR
ncbi:MAG: translation elongation factor Ts [Candidatus Dojkabacteria bacterium]|nr:translation elongation factor Ts [Candidatus Dojkabacteria bacterium]